MRILLTWELGGGLGHLSILILVARRLRDAGHEILFAVKDTGAARRMLEDGRFTFVPCPRVHGSETKQRFPASYSQILAGAGFADSVSLSGLLHSWENIFGLFDPDVIVIQYAPSALIAARLSGIPCLGLHTGFEDPPDWEPFPSFRPWLGLGRESLLKSDRIILDSINQLRKRHGAAEFSCLWQAMKCDINLLAAFPEFDHYRERRGGRYIGSLFITDDGVDIPWPEGGTFRIFVYLKPGAGTLSVLEKLLRHDASVIAFLSGSDAEVRCSISHERLRISSARVKLSSLLPDMDLSVTHANHGTLSALFLAGVPTILIPTTIEQWMLSSNLERLGVGIAVTRNRLGAEFGPAVERMSTDSAFDSAAARYAEKYAGYDQGRTLDRLAVTIERLPHWVRKKR